MSTMTATATRRKPDLAARHGNNSDAFLKEMLGSDSGEGSVAGKGYVDVVNLETEQERDEYPETLGEKFSSYGGCRSQCQ